MSLIRPIVQRLTEKLSSANATNLKNSLLTGGGTVIAALSLLITTPLILQRYGQEGMGILVLSKLLIGLGALLSPGMGQATIKFISKYRAEGNVDRVSRIARTSLAFFFFAGVIAALAQFYAGSWLATEVFKISVRNEQAAAYAFKIGAIGLLAGFTVESLRAILQGFENFGAMVKADTIAQLILFLGTVGIVLGNGSIEQLVTFLCGVKVCELLLQTRMIKVATNLRQLWVPLLDLTVLKETLKFGSVTWVGGLLNTLRNQTPPFLIGAYIGADAVALYNIGTRVLTQFTNVVISATQYVFPYFNKLFETGKVEETKTHFNDITKWMVIVSAAGTTAILTSAEPVIVRWLGDPTTGAQVMDVSKILAARYALLPLGAISFALIVATNKLKALIVVQAAASALTVVATAIGISWNGLIGACWAQLTIFLVVFANRAYIEKACFGHGNLLGQFAIGLALVVPLLLASPFALSAETSIMWAFLSSAVWAIIAALIAWVILHSRSLLSTEDRRMA